MKVMAYSATYSKGYENLPVQVIGRFSILPIEFGDYIDLELLNIMMDAVKRGCQYLVFQDEPWMEIYPRWVDLS